MKETAVISFGRMNPMTNGHEKLADKIKSEASKRNADAKLYLSHSTNPKKDPLDFSTKVKFAKKAFGPMVQNSAARTIIEVAKELTGKYQNLVVVVGSDRIPEFKTLLNKYNGKDFDFKSIEIISAGERDPDSEGVTGMSGSKMRGFVSSNDFNSFKQGVPSKLSDADAKSLFTAVKKGMNLKEEFGQQDEAVLSLSARRGRAQRARRMAKRLARARMIQMKRFADTSRLKRRAVKMAYKFFRRRLSGGKDYASLGTGEKIGIDTRLQKMLPGIKKFAARLIPLARKTELQRKMGATTAKESVNEAFKELFVERAKLPQDKDVSGKEGTQPAKYYKGLDKDTKEKRDAHFKRMGPRSDSDASAYADAPGDKEAREKDMPQSKHTKKYKDMFGEALDRQSTSRLDQLVRMGLADKTLLMTIKRAVGKLDSGDTLNPVERKATQDLLTTLLDMVLSSDTLYRMTRTQLQKEEVQLDELAYKGNIGVMEMFKFFQKATPEQVAEMKKLINEKKNGEALKLLEKVTGVKLKESVQRFALIKEDEDWKDVDGLQMAQIEVANMIEDANDLAEILDSMDEEPEAWVLSKITKATDYIGSVRDYLEFEDDFDMEDDDDEDEDEDDDMDDELEMEMQETFISIDKEDFGDLYEEIQPMFEEIEGLKKKSEKSGISYGILKRVYDRGMAAWQGGHRPGTTPQQWAFARVNSFITKGKGTWGGADSDLASKVSKNEEFTKFFERVELGTDQSRIEYARATPGQSADIINARYSANTALDAINNANVQRMFKLYSEEKSIIKEALEMHLDKKIPFVENVFRVGSKNYFEFFREARKLHEEGKIQLSSEDKNLIEETDIGKFAFYEDNPVPLDCPMMEEEEEKDPPLNQPKRGGSKKFYVFVRDPSTGNIKKVSWGDTTGLSVKLNDPEARKSFAARHQCSTQKDRTSAAYWACNTPRYAKQLGLSGGGNFFW
jgi:hypothetical protein